MDKDGKLTWDVPEGDWTILRIGHTPTGAVNAPSTDSGRGLECDKMSREAMDVHWKNGIEPVLEKLGPLAGKSFNNLLIDSYEVGDSNWTPKFREIADGAATIRFPIWSRSPADTSKAAKRPSVSCGISAAR